MSDCYFSNFVIEEGTEYFLYIGELKNYGLNLFMRDALSRIFNRRFDFIAIVPDVFEQYNYENLIVINPRVKEFIHRYGPNVSCRITADEFMKSVSQNRQVRSLIQRLLHRQPNIYIYMYESLLEMTLDSIPGVTLLGPDRQVARRVNSKSFQYTELKNLLPLVEFEVCHSLTELIGITEKRRQLWRDGIFVTKDYSAAGIYSLIVHGSEEIRTKFKDENEIYLASHFIPHDKDPTVLAVVANEDDIYIVGVADQMIEDGRRFIGSTFPTMLDPLIVNRLREYTVIAGRWLARQGYRGIFGCDFLVDHNSNIFFLEINARKQGTTLEFCCTLEQLLPPGVPNLPELEYYAVEEGILPIDSVEMKGNTLGLHWGTYNYKLHRTVRTNGFIPQSNQERDAFKKVARGNLKKDFLILEHIGSDFIIAGGAFLARIVALGHDPAGVQQGLLQGRKTIELTISELIDSESTDE
jgi:hypothetical protein